MIKILLALLVAGPTSAADTKKVQPISDVDYGHLKTAPKFSWGTDLFARVPGFAAVDVGEQDPTPGKLHLDALIYDPKDAMAIVNGQSVEVGDEVDGFQITEIGPNFVIVEMDNSRFELTLPPIREPAKAKHAEIVPAKENLK